MRDAFDISLWICVDVAPRAGANIRKIIFGHVSQISIHLITFPIWYKTISKTKMQVIDQRKIFK